jgi:hypothetical protein
MSADAASQLRWGDLADEARTALTGRLAGLWGAPTDEAAFDNLAVDKQQALLLHLRRMRQLDLWSVMLKVTNVYGDKGEGVGMSFDAAPLIETTLSRRKDFTRFFANHPDTTGGFYEKGRDTGVLHFLYLDKRGEERKWMVHFDLYSPVYSLASAACHLRYEIIGRFKPDWRAIAAALRDTA